MAYVNGLHGGKDTELRNALTEQQRVLDALKQQQAANEDANKINNHDGMKLALAIMLLMVLFK